MEKSWKITLSDGTQFKGLKLNGNNFVSQKLQKMILKVNYQK